MYEAYEYGVRIDPPPPQKPSFKQLLTCVFEFLFGVNGHLRSILLILCSILSPIAWIIVIIKMLIKYTLRIISKLYPQQIELLITIQEMIDRYFALYELISSFITLLVSFPLWILGLLGIPTIPGIFAWCHLCALCTCGAFLGITSSVGVAVGIGLGVGLNCAETQYYPIQNATNITNTTALLRNNTSF